MAQLDCDPARRQDTPHGADKLSTWLEANRDGLLIGLIVAVVIVAVMLVLREFGRRALRRDPEGWGWRSVIGRVLAKTSIAFMILAAADVVSSYAELPHKIARLLDILFVIAFALQGAVWGRELILGLIGHRVARQNGSGSLGSAMAIIRVLSAWRSSRSPASSSSTISA